MVQIDGPRRQVYIKFVEFQRLQEVLHSTNGHTEYRHDNGEISQVRIEMAGMGTRRVRIANLPPEIPDGTVRLAPSKYVEIKDIQEESWSRAYRYSVANGIRIVVIALTKHIPSHMTIAGNRVLMSYEGQPMTRYGYGETGHPYQVCPKRRRVGVAASKEPIASWADIAASGTRSQRLDFEKGKEGAHHRDKANQVGGQQA
jgi:hypothetical protein